MCKHHRRERSTRTRFPPRRLTSGRSLPAGHAVGGRPVDGDAVPHPPRPPVHVRLQRHRAGGHPVVARAQLLLARALVIRPRLGAGAYPFPTKPDGEETTVILGEWWNAETLPPSGAPADAYTINGEPGDQYGCQSQMTANRTPGVRVVVFIHHRPSPLTESSECQGRRTVPLAVDTRMFVTVGLGLRPCDPAQTTTPCVPSSSSAGGFVQPVASMNNQSPALPTSISMLDARRRNTTDFPDAPPVEFDNTNGTGRLLAAARRRCWTPVEMVLQSTALVGRESHPMHLHGFNFFVLAQGFGNYDAGAAPEQFNLVNPQERNTIAVPTGGWAVIRFVADNPAYVHAESLTAYKSWFVRVGMWFMHCHIYSHLAIGLAMVFEVDDGPTSDTALPPPPPPDLPQPLHKIIWSTNTSVSKERVLDGGFMSWSRELDNIYGNPIQAIPPEVAESCQQYIYLSCSFGLSYASRPHQDSFASASSSFSDSAGLVSGSTFPSMVQLLLALALLLVGPVADAATAKYTFTVGSMQISQLCRTTSIIAVNGQLPGPSIEVNEGDDVVVKVINNSPYNVTIHWHGVLQLMTPWADGPSLVTQCPIQPGSSYTYSFSVPGQEGTLWWHAHSSFLRATVYGAFIIRPRSGNAYPFPAPDKEVPIVLGEWWNRNVVDVENDALLAGQLPAQSDAFTINGKTGLLYQCANETFTAVVEPNTSVLLRVINAGLNSHLFFKLAGHNFTVVAVDAGYTSNLNTDTLVIAPGQTVDALVTTSAAPGSYYMAVLAYDTMSPLTFAASDTTTASAVFQYNGTATNPPAMPTMPSSSDSGTANAFYFGLRGLGTPAVPSPVDVSMTIELGLGQLPCDPSQTKCNGTAAAAAMNGVSFRLPAPETSLLGAHMSGVTGVFTADFPDAPPASGTAMAVGTKVRKLSYNSVVEIVLQNPAAVPTENHPIHLHGFNFFVLAQGMGTFTPASVAYNLVDPVARNTIAVPGGGWAVIRFLANNPGMWFFHCHLDPHVPMGLGMVFQVESGTTAGSALPAPPADWVGLCDAQHYATAAAAPEAAPASAPALAPAPAGAPAESPQAAGSAVQPPRAVDHTPSSPSLPQHRAHALPSSNSSAGSTRAIGHFFTCTARRGELRGYDASAATRSAVLATMARRAPMLLVLLIIPAAALCTVASAAVVEHTFYVGGMGISQLCMNRLIYTVNQQMPGPTIEANQGDTLVVHVINASPYPLSVHWHGVFQLQSGWADGALMITQCPIKPSDKFTYVFNVTGQEGTLWWHAHASMLRATIYGALIIRPRSGYPFPTPDAEVPILLGEWWNRNVDDVETDGLLTGLGPATSDALTINGSPGDQAPCGGAGMFQLEVERGKTYLLRIINAAVNTELFFRVAGHAFTVVAADASYTSPYATDVVVVAPGQTVDALMAAAAAPGRYYMAARAFESHTVANPPPFDRAVATAVVRYRGVPDYAPAAVPALPPYTDVATAGRFYWSLTGLVRPGDPVVPRAVDHSMVVAFGLDTAPCAPDQTKCRGFALVASMNRYSFRFPDRASVSLLEALFRGVPNVYSEDFPDAPAPAPAPRKVTSVRKVNLGDVVEVVLQNEGYSSVLGAENHPIHLHGFNFFVLAQGLGRFDPRLRSTFNLVNPQVRNTVAVPAGGWAVIRFTANNPGMWFMHCHLDAHLPLGLAMVFEVTNGPAPYLLPPPPADYP
ncbi:hypothetical protein U9M48_017133, partial [Paspalum notatum var. saurae]